MSSGNVGEHDGGEHRPAVGPELASEFVDGDRQLLLGRAAEVQQPPRRDGRPNVPTLWNLSTFARAPAVVEGVLTAAMSRGWRPGWNHRPGGAIRTTAVAARRARFRAYSVSEFDVVRQGTQHGGLNLYSLLVQQLCQVRPVLGVRFFDRLPLSRIIGVRADDRYRPDLEWIDVEGFEGDTEPTGERGVLAS
jgi:hypothetical protein